jgi:hypothetical protein
MCKNTDVYSLELACKSLTLPILESQELAIRTSTKETNGILLVCLKSGKKKTVDHLIILSL